jgi:hypothetical protein
MGNRFRAFVTAQVTCVIASLVASLGCAGVLRASPWEGAQIVPREIIVAALRQEQAQGYRIDAVANSVRLQSGVMLAIAEAMSTANPQRQPYRIDHRDYYLAFLEVTGLTPETAPSFVKAPYAAREDYLVDARLEKIFDLDATVDLPQRALNVKAGWPPVPGAPTSYSYEDHSTDPAIETKREQVTSWRILDYGQAIVYDDIQGVGGRAISGLLGAIFSLIGHAQALQTRFAIAEDGTQVSRTTAHKVLTLTQTITIRPDGRVLTGLPDNRPDLERLERMLINLPMRVTYLPMDRSPMPPAEN